MKIKTDELPRVVTDQTRKRPGQKEAAKFGELLRRTIDSTETQVRKGTDLQGAAGVQNVRITAVIEEQQGPILERVEQLLDTLEEYQQNLGTPRIPSDLLTPIVNRMEDHNKALAAVLVTLPDGDSLKDILNRVLITSVVEVEKFKRGDYS
jgi:hypothetical protein